MAEKIDRSFWLAVAKRVFVAALVIFVSMQLSRYFGPPDSITAEKYYLDGQYDKAIETSTTTIERYSDSPLRTDALILRGRSYQAKHDFTHAIADYDEAKRLRPDDPKAATGLCDALQLINETDRALVACNEAATLGDDAQEPREHVVQMLLAKGDIPAATAKIEELIELRARKGTSTLDYRFYRGQVALFYDNRPAEAAGDFAATLASALDYRETGKILGPQYINGEVVRDLMAYQHAFVPDAYYTVLWLRIARAKTNQDYATEFAANSTRLGYPTEAALALSPSNADKRQEMALQTWPGPILSMYLGKTTPQAIRDSIGQIADPAVRQRRSCEADFYSGERALEQNRREDAETFLQAAVTDCPKDAREYGFAMFAIQQRKICSR